MTLVALIILWAFIALLVVGFFAQPYLIGKPRRPLTAKYVVYSTLFYAVIIGALGWIALFVGGSL